MLGGMMNHPMVAAAVSCMSLSSRTPATSAGANLPPSFSTSLATARATASALVPRATLTTPWCTPFGSSRWVTSDRYVYDSESTSAFASRWRASSSRRASSCAFAAAYRRYASRVSAEA